jgi:hypothetical protein
MTARIENERFIRKAHQIGDDQDVALAAKTLSNGFETGAPGPVLVATPRR